MHFKDVIGQESVKAVIRKEVEEKRLPHALLFTGPVGCGKLATAVALANSLLCQHVEKGDSCGKCSACKRVEKYVHPDLHFSFPIIKKGSITTCEDYRKEWNEILSTSMYFDFEDWLDAMGADSKQALIPEAESDSIINQVSMSSYEGGNKVMIIWLPEKMRGEAANNLLKTLEEPPHGTIFILVSNDISTMLPTILSRVQTIVFRSLSSSDIAEALELRNGLDHSMAMQIARISGGSYLKALKMINVCSEAGNYFNFFTQFMRLVYTRDLKALKDWSDNVASWGREKQKSFMAYMQNMVRENFVYNFCQSELNFMSNQELQFATKFSCYINERNVVEFMNEFAKAQRDIEQNVYSRSVLFNMALNCIIHIRK